MQWTPDGWTPKAVAVDIDGTITDKNKKIHLGAIAALRRLEGAGIPVILSTGNVRAITYGLWRFIGATGPMVCEMEELSGTLNGESRFCEQMGHVQKMLQICWLID